MNLKKIKKYFDHSFLVIPHHEGHQKKSFVLNTPKIFLILSAFTISLLLVLFVFLKVTPIGNYLFGSIEYKNSQNREIATLNKRIVFLTKELEQVASLNKKLKYAIFLGDSNLVDSIKKVKKEKSKKDQVGGNLLFIIRKIFFPDDTTHLKERIYFIKPINGFITRNYNTDQGHFGIDFAVKSGTPIVASASGFVIFADYTSDDGYTIMVMHGNKYISVYKHCSELTKKIRDNVVQGETIALSGNSGVNTSGPHLHFEIWLDGQVINPNSILIK